MTYIYKVSLQCIKALENIRKCFACACILCCFRLCELLQGHALWMRLSKQLSRSLTKVVNHSFSGQSLSWVCDSIKINSP